MKPPTLEEASARRLLTTNGIHTFSNGTEWDCWAARNCYECRHYDVEEAGACAFEVAAMLGTVSPALALLFGWTEDADYPGSFNAPESCRFHRDREEDDDGETRPEDSTDPTQLVLIADPTEIIGQVTAPEPQRVEVMA